LPSRMTELGAPPTTATTTTPRAPQHSWSNPGTHVLPAIQLYIAADFFAAWQVYQADSLAEIQEIVDSFPLTRFVTTTITPLQPAVV
jgi:muconolactone delta-isomerase